MYHLSSVFLLFSYSHVLVYSFITSQASNGASDYGNKYGEPVVCGFARSFGQRVPSGERVEWYDTHTPTLYDATTHHLR